MRMIAIVACAALATGCHSSAKQMPWRMATETPGDTVDAMLLARIGRALDAAEQAGTNPSISNFHVRAATVVQHAGQDHVVVGGNTEYLVPEAVHGEVSLINHVVARFGAAAAHRVPFVAFYSQTCGDSRGCGDCRDYMRAATSYRELLWVCGRASDRTIHVRRFADGLVDEEEIPDVAREAIGLPSTEIDRLLNAARLAQSGGITLFTTPAQQTGAAVLTWSGRIYKASGADDAAFHYRYPIGGALQQAATEKDYFIRAVLVAGQQGTWPRIMYRDRQYGLEASSFGGSRGFAPTRLILVDGDGRFRATTFEAALPHPFSVARFNPGALERFLARQIPPVAAH